MSVRKRFAFTLGANLLRSLISFTTGMLLARWLGPAVYGQMAFLLGTFLAIRQLWDMGSSTAFFTFMSQRPRSRRFVNAFLAWLGVQFILPLCLIGLLFSPQLIETIWRGEHRGLVLAAFIAAFMQNNLWPVLQQAGESQRQTVRVQSIAVVVVAVHLLAVLALWLLGVLGLYALFAATALEYFVAATVARRSLSYAPGDASVPAAGARQDALKQYLAYCLPLAPYAWVGFAYEFADRWLLQRFGGSVQQAYYAVSAQLAAIALIATSSILNIFWKEIAEAHHNGDSARMNMLYRRISRLLFLVGVAIAGYLCHWSEDLLRLLLGAAYVGGAPTLAIMLLYPVHQSLGQIGNTFLFAANRAPIQVVAGIVYMIVSIVVSYFVLATEKAPVPGLGLASTGLALKMVVLQLIQVNILAYIIARLWKWRFDWAYQPVGMLGCIAAGWLTHEIAMGIAGDAWPIPAVMALGAAMYLIVVAALIYVMPWLTGFKREDFLNTRWIHRNA